MTNLERLRARLRELELNAFIVTNMPNVRWLTGFTGSFAIAVVAQEHALLVTDSRYSIQAAEQCSCMPCRSYANPTNVVDFLKVQLDAVFINRLAFDKNQVTIATHGTWREKFIGVELEAVDDPIDELRMIKSVEEVAKVRAACAVTDACLKELLAIMKPGATELQLLWAFEDMLRECGATAAFQPIIVSGPRTARPHGEASSRVLQRGDFVTIDIGARLDGYCSDITRTVALGSASSRQREVYEHLLFAQEACIKALRPGQSGKEIDGLARKILDEKGLAKHFGHGLGHGLGALVHDSGRLSQLVDDQIAQGQIWTVEPGVYIEGEFGLRIEDDVLITESGCEVLTQFPKHLIELPW